MANWTTFSVISVLVIAVVAINVLELSESRVLIAPNVVNCTTYNASACIPSVSQYCLSNGTSVSNFCQASEAVCTDGLQLVDCPDNTNNNNTAARSACAMTTTLFTVTVLTHVILP